jgi:hypothetical protein
VPETGSTGWDAFRDFGSWGWCDFTPGLAPSGGNQKTTVWIYLRIEYWEIGIIKMRNKLSPIQPISQIGEGL